MKMRKNYRLSNYVVTILREEAEKQNTTETELIERLVLLNLVHANKEKKQDKVKTCKRTNNS